MKKFLCLTLLSCLFSEFTGSGVAAPVPSSLVSSNSVWSYLDDGSDLGWFWSDPLFTDDVFWAQGGAELGYGDEVEGRPETTVISFGIDPENKYITTYFRHAFEVDEPGLIEALTLRLLRDDGAVVYLNGVEVFRTGMPDGTIDYQTLASAPISGSDEDTFLEAELDPESLAAGQNILAVEMHQAAPNDPDLSFALELIAWAEPPPPPMAEVVRGPYLQAGTQTNIVLRWRTNVPTNSVVQVGFAPDVFKQIIVDETFQVDHSIVVSGLLPNTRYYYSVGTTETNFSTGPDHTFLTAPAVPKPTRIWAIGDFGTTGLPGGSGALAVLNAYENYAGNRNTDIWLMLGDNAYYSGTDAEYQRSVFDVYQRLLRQTSPWPTIGNHETYGPNPDGTIAYQSIFDPPIAGQAGGVPSGDWHYYSFNYANIHFVCLDSELSDRSDEGPMATWLREDLAANTQDWLIAFWHSPPYTKGSHDSDRIFDTAGHLVHMRQVFVPILESYGVDLVLGGHSHVYERSFLLNGHYGFSDTLTAEMIIDDGSGQPGDSGAYRKPALGPGANQGAVYNVVGCSGWATFFVGEHPVMYSSLLQTGSLVVDVDGNKLEAKFLRENGQVDDSYSIIKGGPAEPFRIFRYKRPGGVPVLRWHSIPGRKYQVQIRSEVPGEDWSIVSPVLTGKSSTIIWTGEEPEFGGSAFYRIVEVP